MHESLPYPYWPLENNRKPVKLKRGKAGRAAVWLHMDFAKKFLLKPRWKKEMTVENERLIQYHRFDLPCKRINAWMTEALALFALSEL